MFYYIYIYIIYIKEFYGYIEKTEEEKYIFNGKTINLV